MRPANLSRPAVSWPPAGEAALPDQSLGVGDDFLHARAELARLLGQVLAHGLDLTLQAAAVLPDRALDQVAALAQLALEPSPGALDLALEPVAGGRAAALVAPELVLEGGPAGV